MRTAPSDILSDLRRRFGRDLDIQWDMNVHQWMLFWKGEPQFTLCHRDGSPVIDLNLGELKQILRKSDQHVRFGDVIREMRKRRENRQFREGRAVGSYIGDAGKEAKKAMRAHYAPRVFESFPTNPVHGKEGVPSHA